MISSDTEKRPAAIQQLIDATPTLSALLALAIEDMKKVQADSRYVLDMSGWHRPGPEGCHVCLAGAVMAKRLNMPHDWELDSLDFEKEITKRLDALDYLRQGHLEQAIREFHDPLEQDEFPSCKLPDPLAKALKLRQDHDPEPLRQMVEWLRTNEL